MLLGKLPVGIGIEMVEHLSLIRKAKYLGIMVSVDKHSTQMVLTQMETIIIICGVQKVLSVEQIINLIVDPTMVLKRLPVVLQRQNQNFSFRLITVLHNPLRVV
jgi:hypothetical protein